jgi:hypothetical protein
VPVVVVHAAGQVAQQVPFEPGFELVGGALVQHLQGEDGGGVLDGPGVDLVERLCAVPDSQITAEVAAHGDEG